MKDIIQKIRRARSKYVEFRMSCEEIAKIAQKHINWNDDVSCDLYPSDGICIEIESRVCPVDRFFQLVADSEYGIINEELYIRNCI